MYAQVERKTMEIQKIKREADELRHLVTSKETLLEKMKL